MLLVALGELLGLPLHPLDVRLREPVPVVGHGHVIAVGGCLVLGGHRQDPVVVDVAGHSNLRDAPGCWGNPVQIEGSYQEVVRHHRPVTFVDVDLDTGLVVGVGREGLRVLGRDGGPLLDDGGSHTARRLDGDVERSHVEQQHALGVRDLHVPLEHCGLVGCAESDRLVRMHAVLDLALAEEPVEVVHDLWDPSGPSDQDDLVDLPLGAVDVGDVFLLVKQDAVLGVARLHLACARLARLVLHKAALHPVDTPPEEVLAQHLELGLREVHLQPGGVHEERDVDLRRQHVGERLLRVLARRPQPPLRRVAEGVRRVVLARVHRNEGLDGVVEDPVVEVHPSQEVVPVRALHVRDGPLLLVARVVQDAHVEGAPPEVVHHYVLVHVVALLLLRIAQGGCRRLHDQADVLEARDLPCGLRPLLLVLAEVGRHRYHRVRYLALQAQLLLRRVLQVLQDVGRDLRRVEQLLLALDLNLDRYVVHCLVRGLRLRRLPADGVHPHHLEGPVLQGLEDVVLVEPPSYQSLYVVHRLLRDVGEEGLDCPSEHSRSGFGVEHHYRWGDSVTVWV